MQIGYFQNIHDVSKRRDYGDMLAELREIAVLCDEAGVDTFWLPEHHFSIWGRELLPNPIVMAADIAARTKRIRIGLSAAIITFWHPLRLAEDIGLLDQITGGRLELGVGRGNYGLEATNLNPVADPNDQLANIKVFEETLEILKRAFRDKRFSYRGDIYQFPAPGFSADRAHSVDDPEYVDPETGELVKLSIYPRPRQRPWPPLWQVVNSERSIQHAAEMDCGIIMWRPSVRSLKERLKLYRKSMKEYHGRDIPMGARTAVLRDSFIAKTEEEAIRVAGGPLMGALNFANWRGPSIYLDPGEKIDPDLEAALKKELTLDFVRERSLIFGSPDQVVEKLVEHHEVTGIQQVVMKCSWPGFEHRHTMSSLELLASEVLPRVRARTGGTPRDGIAAAE